MRILIISDIHANLTALETVLSKAGEVDATWCLGDLVGYGPDPNECIEQVQALPNLACILGNHDSAALNQIDPNTFNPEARTAIQWTQRTLTEKSRKFLSGLPDKMVVEDVTITHGSPRHPVWEYLLDTRAATISFTYFDTPFCFVGHTHLPVLYSLDDGSDYFANLRIPQPNEAIELPVRSIANPGSVGQPRDRDTRASFAIFDTETHIWDYQRTPYDIPSVQVRMQKAGLPERHIYRLASGW